MSDLNARIIPKASGTAGEVPQAADLDVAEIAVNTADGKLYTKDSSETVKEVGGGSGGAVDSVNGQTGVVQLGVFDLTDIAERTRTQFLGLTTYTTGSPVGANEWKVGNSGGRGFIQFPASAKASMDLLTDGTVLELEAPNYPNFLTVAFGSPGTGDPGQITFVDELPSAWLSIPTGALQLSVLSTVFPAVLDPPDPGDALIWVDSVQAFGPAAIPNSVNGRTGDVTLGIQDMDDFGLRLEPAVGSTQNFSGSANYTPGTCFYTSTGTPELYVSNTDINGDATVNLPSLGSAGTCVYSVNGGTDGNFILNYFNVVDAIGQPTIRLLIDDAFPTTDLTGLNNAQTGDQITLQFAAGPDFVPLATGDVIQWNNAVGKFQPGPVEQSIFDLTDVSRNTAPIFRWDDVSSSGATVPGRYDVRSNGNRVLLNPVDSNGNDCTTLFFLGTTPVTWYISVGNGPFVETQIAGRTNSGAFYEFTGIVPTVPDNNPPLRITFSPPVIDPLDGQMLDWITSLGEWRPTNVAFILKTAILDSTDFADFQSRISNL